MTDFLSFNSVSFEHDTNIGRLCEVLNTKFASGLWHGKLKIQNTSWLWFVNRIVAAMNKDKLRCGVFGLYPACVTGI
jgi:hypothetical protein